MDKNSKRLNPYIAGKPLTSDEGFFGRDEIINRVRITLENSQNNLILIYGQRRIGKTSILLKLVRSLSNPPFFPVYIDLMDKGKKSINDVLFDIATICSRKADVETPDKAAFLANSDEFHLSYLPNLYDKLGNDSRPIFLFDEFDVLDQTLERFSEDSAAIQFHPYLRKLIANEPRIGFVFVVGRRMEELTYDFLSTFKSAQTIPVFVLENEATYDLINKSKYLDVIFEDTAIEVIMHYTRGHPYFTQLLCQEIFDRYVPHGNYETIQITVDMVEASVSSALESGKAAFIWIWNGLPSAERIVFSAIAEKSVSGQLLTEDTINRSLLDAGIKLRMQEFNLAPSKLVEWKMLEKIKGGYKFYIELMRRWVEHNRPLWQVKEELTKINPLADKLYKIADSFYYDHSQPEQALENLKKVLDLNPNHIKARILLGTIYREKKNYPEAIEEFKAAFSLDDQVVLHDLKNSMLEYGEILEQNGENDKAEKIYTEILSAIYENEETAKERKSKILINRARVFEEENDYLAAYKTYLEAGAYEKANNLISELSSTARNFDNQGDLQNAEKTYLSLIELQPDEKVWQNNLKEIRRRKANKDKIQDFVSKAKLALEENRFDVAEDYLKQASRIKDSEQYSEINDQLERVQLLSKVQEIIHDAKNSYKEKHVERAIELIDEALDLQPSNKEAQELRSAIRRDEEIANFLITAKKYFTKRDYDAAEKLLVHVIELQPSNQEAEELLYLIEEKIKAIKEIEATRKPSYRKAITIGSGIVIGIGITILAVLVAFTNFGSYFFPSLDTPTTTQITQVTLTPETFSGIYSGRFVFLNLGEVVAEDNSPAPSTSAYENLQLAPGYNIIQGVPLFYELEINTQNSSSQDYPQILSLQTNIQNPLAVYFLIQADWGYSRYEGEHLGKIILKLDGGISYEYPLIMGENIRDWKRGDAPEAVTSVTSPDILFSWNGIAPDGHSGGIDLLRISIPVEYQNQSINQIQVVDSSLDSISDINPGIRILAGSVEIQDETPGPWIYQIERLPITDTELKWELTEGELLIITGGSLRYQDFSCGGNASQICILVIQASVTQQFTLDRLVPQNNWLAVSTTVSPAEAIESVQGEFWLPPNCGDGCNIATVAIFSDSTEISTYKINRPDQ